jgi:hypothetical protein
VAVGFVLAVWDDAAAEVERELFAKFGAGEAFG